VNGAEVRLLALGRRVVAERGLAAQRPEIIRFDVLEDVQQKLLFQLAQKDIPLVD
jgi:hypothetical protein